MTQRNWKIVSPGGSRRVVVTRELPGEPWLQLSTPETPHLIGAHCRTDSRFRAGDVEPPRAAPSIVNADDLGLPRLAAGLPTKEDHQ